MADEPAPNQNSLVRYTLGTIDQFLTPRRHRFRKLLIAAFGSVPWVGSLLSGLANLRDQERQEETGEFHREWLEEHAQKFQRVGHTVMQLMERLDELGTETQARIESEAYLGLVRKAFRAWDSVDTEEKRDLLRKLLANSGASTIDPDDLIRLFIEWIEKYHEAHFQVIRVIYQNPGVTRGDIWDTIHGTPVREDSAEADLFKLLIRDLSTGSVIRQARQTDTGGRFLRKATPTRRAPTPYMKSAFDDKDKYVLTELGEKFVHYTMDDVVPRVAGGAPKT
jgi:hypothetical protein